MIFGDGGKLWGGQVARNVFGARQNVLCGISDVLSVEVG